MATMTTPYDAPPTHQRATKLRQMLTGAAAFDAAGGVFCLAAAGKFDDWLSIPRAGAYVTGAIFLAAAVAGVLTVRREPLQVSWVVAANEVFAAWCVVMLAADHPNGYGGALLVAATLTSAGTGAAELVLARR